jgi:hypothetical protein
MHENPVIPFARASDKEPLATAKEVATRIGASVDTVYRHLPCIRIAPGVIRYDMAKVILYLKNNSLPFARRRRTCFAPRK